MHLVPEPFRRISASWPFRSPIALPQPVSITKAETLSSLSPRQSLAVASVPGGSLNFFSHSSLNPAASGSDWKTSLREAGTL